MDESLSDFQRWLDASPFQAALEIRVMSIDVGSGYTTMRLPHNAPFGRRVSTREFHGGVIATLIDISGSAALFAARGYTGPTIDMRIDYLRLAEGEFLAAESRLVKNGRSLALADVQVSDDCGRIVAVGRVALSTQKVHIARESTLRQT